MKFPLVSSNLMLSYSNPLCSSFLFECTKSFLLNGYHVHFITKARVEEIPFKFHGGANPGVEAFSRLSFKYIMNADQLLEYGCDLQYIKTRQCKLPKVVILQDLGLYLEDERKGVLALAMLVDALNALAKAYNSQVYILVGLICKTPSTRILPSLIDIFFTSTWKLCVDNESGSVVKLQDYSNKQNSVKEIKFKIGEETIFMEEILKTGNLSTNNK